MTENTINGTVFAGCKIIEKIGQGGMGTVYKAHHETLDTIVCVKLLSPELARDQRNIDFFLREARSAAKLDHPNIVHVYNFGQENNQYFIVMSYVEGKSMQDMIEQRGPLPVPEATELIAGLLDGLAHAHSKEIIHRDIKPSNVLVDLQGKPHIADFGLARSLNEEKQLTMAGEMIGTAYFMSPEQCLAGKVDSRADLYSVGATYFYMLTGKYPFDGKTSVEVIHKHIGEPVPNPLLINPDIPLWASRAIERLMRKKPEERYQKAEDVALELRKYNSGELDISRTSTEQTFDMPELTSRIMASAPPPPPPPPPGGGPAAAPAMQMMGPLPTESDHGSQPQPPQQEIAGAAKTSGAAKPKFQLPLIHNAIKVIMHLALTASAAGCFMLAGASGRVSGSLTEPLASNPALTGIFAVFGLALAVWALWMKPRKFTLLYALFALAAAAACYAGGAFIPAPDGSDVAAKAFLAVTALTQNLASPAMGLVYALCLYLLASKIVFHRSWMLRLTGAACYLAGLALTYAYFTGGAAIVPDRNWMAAAGVLALIGLTAAFTRSKVAFFLNPQLCFLAANLSIFAMSATPRIALMTQEKASVEEEKAARINSDKRDDYRRMVEAARAEILYDVDGRQIERKLPPPPQEVKPRESSVLQAQAKVDYYAEQAARFRSTMADTAGLALIGLFLALLTNICFIEELLEVYREDESCE